MSSRVIESIATPLMFNGALEGAALKTNTFYYTCEPASLYNQLKKRSSVLTLL